MNSDVSHFFNISSKMMAKTHVTVTRWILLLSSILRLGSSKSFRGSNNGQQRDEVQLHHINELDPVVATSSSTQRILLGELENEIDFYWTDLERDFQIGPINDGEWILRTSSVAPGFTSKGPDPTIRLILDNYDGSFYVTGVSYILYEESLVESGHHTIKSIATRGKETTLNYYVSVTEFLYAANDTQWFRFSVSDTWGYVEEVNGVLDFSGLRDLVSAGQAIGIYPLDYVEGGCDGCDQPKYATVTDRNALIFSADAFGPTEPPSTSPTGQPSHSPSHVPTGAPSAIPSITLSQRPTITPSQTPSVQPSGLPSDVPSSLPSSVPTVGSKQETKGITVDSTMPNTWPSDVPSSAPSDVQVIALPSDVPSSLPSEIPSDAPTVAPSVSDFFFVDLPSASPSDMPSLVPSDAPSMLPSDAPSMLPTRVA